MCLTEMVLVDSEAIAEIEYRLASATLFVRLVEGEWYPRPLLPAEYPRPLFLPARSLEVSGA